MNLLIKELNVYNNIEERINKGVEYLNKNYPDWLEKVNVSVLDSNSNCVLKQVSDSKDCNDLNTELGFWRVLGMKGEPTPEILTILWKKKIMGLREKGYKVVDGNKTIIYHGIRKVQDLHSCNASVILVQVEDSIEVWEGQLDAIKDYYTDQGYPDIKYLQLEVR